MAKANRYKKKENYRLWNIYHSMKKRCYNENCKRYKDYGGRGIEVCDEWLAGFDFFAEWAYQNGYEENLTIDRENNDGDYTPQNCRWITNKEQCNNTRANLYIEYKGRKQTLTKWCEELNLRYYTVQRRLKNGWEVEKAFTKPSQQQESFSRLCKEHNINPTTVICRIKAGWSKEEALNTPTKGRGAGASDYGRAKNVMCAECGKEFTPKNAIHKYCSSECREKAEKKEVK